MTGVQTCALPIYDLVDSTTQALLRFRQGGFIRLPTDEPEDVQWFKGYRKERYYTV